MTIDRSCQSYDEAHRAIMDEIPRAEHKHPEELRIEERWEAVHKELYEVLEAISRRDWRAVMKEFVHTGVCLYRLMKAVKLLTGTAIR